MGLEHPMPALRSGEPPRFSLRVIPFALYPATSASPFASATSTGTGNCDRVHPRSQCPGGEGGANLEGVTKGQGIVTVSRF
jgi:hypothetical protein